jgi:hypothetical protein
MLTPPQIDKLKAHPQMGSITALTSAAIRGLLAEGSFQLSLLDEQNPVEIQSPAVDGLLQPVTGGRAEVQAGGVVSGDGESADANRDSWFLASG